MTKKKIEIEVEYPDCGLCGRGIEENEEYLGMVFTKILYTCHGGAYSGVSSRGETVLVCRDCAVNRIEKIVGKIGKAMDESIRGTKWEENENKQS